MKKNDTLTAILFVYTIACLFINGRINRNLRLNTLDQMGESTVFDGIRIFRDLTIVVGCLILVLTLINSKKWFSDERILSTLAYFGLFIFAAIGMFFFRMDPR